MTQIKLRIDGDRLWRSLMLMGEVGATPGGGSCRLALTKADIAGRELFQEWCLDAGCTLSNDDMGNLYARRQGTDAEALPIVVGSHLDTQPCGGQFDGVYGVLAGLEVVRSLNDASYQTKAPIDLVVWTNEEGSRFAPAMIASGVFAGLFSRKFALSRQDQDGMTQAEALLQSGFVGTEPCGEHKFGAFLEAHIEQGPILEANQKTIGVVTGGQGSIWHEVTLSGQDSHAGSTPMASRKDALVAAAGIVLAVQEVAKRHAPQGVGTVGTLQVTPNSRNTIPGAVFLTIDIRHPDYATLCRMNAELRDQIETLVKAEKVDLLMKQIWDNLPAVFDDSIVAIIRKAANDLGYGHQDIVSGAGHDACQVSRVAPTGMIFVPCADGVSHNEAESAEPIDLEQGCNVLLQAVMRLAC